MSNLLSRVLQLNLLLLISTSIFAQRDAGKQVCESATYQQTVDSIKEYFTAQGYTVLKEAAVQMESENETPIMLPMQQGISYQFVFIGDPTSRVYEVKMYDYSEKQVVHKKTSYGEAEANVISYNYVPKLSEYHMVKPRQVNKEKKKICGYVMLLKKPQA